MESKLLDKPLFLSVILSQDAEIILKNDVKIILHAGSEITIVATNPETHTTMETRLVPELHDKIASAEVFIAGDQNPVDERDFTLQLDPGGPFDLCLTEDEEGTLPWEHDDDEEAEEN